MSDVIVSLVHVTTAGCRGKKCLWVLRVYLWGNIVKTVIVCHVELMWMVGWWMFEFIRRMSVDLGTSDCWGSSVGFQTEFDVIDDPKCQLKHSPGGNLSLRTGWQREIGNSYLRWRSLFHFFLCLFYFVGCRQTFPGILFISTLLYQG
jgi:hypothetical protein